MFYIGSSVVLLILAIGIWQRRNRKVHIPLMISAFTLDVLLVLIIEIQRHAVEKLVAQELSPFTMFHAGISLLVLLLYGAMGYTGYQLAKNNAPFRPWHRSFSIAFVGLRLTNYVTSFFVS